MSLINAKLPIRPMVAIWIKVNQALVAAGFWSLKEECLIITKRNNNLIFNTISDT